MGKRRGSEDYPSIDFDVSCICIMLRIIKLYDIKLLILLSLNRKLTVTLKFIFKYYSKTCLY